MTTEIRPARTAFFAVLAGLAGLAGGYASGGWTRDYYALVVSDWVTETTPAAVMNWSIENLGTTAEDLQVLGALALAFAVLAGIAALGLQVGYRQSTAAPLGGALAASLAGGVGFLLTGVALQTAVLAAVVGLVVAVGEGLATGAETPTDLRRREIVGGVGALVGFGVLSKLVGDVVTDRALAIDASDLETAEAAMAAVDDAQATDLGIEGVQQPISPIGNFYTVSKNAAPEIVDEEHWELSVTGEVDREVTIDYEGLRARESEGRFIALRCIGDDLNGDLMDTAHWTGIPLWDLLSEAGADASHVELRAADGYVASVQRSTLSDAFLAYGMNGRLLPRQHGYPARIHIPSTWGELNVKWVQELHVTDDPQEGFYEERGWNGHARVPAVAKIWTSPVNRLDDGRLEVGGHAYAGDRGVERVEVSTDGGATWNEAELAEPLPGDDVTRQWRYRYSADSEHEVVARTIDGEGNLQPRERSMSFPAGPSGWVRKSVDP